MSQIADDHFLFPFPFPVSNSTSVSSFYSYPLTLQSEPWTRDQSTTPIQPIYPPVGSLVPRPHPLKEGTRLSGGRRREHARCHVHSTITNGACAWAPKSVHTLAHNTALGCSHGRYKSRPIHNVLR